jgi:hypothetical protein
MATKCFMDAITWNAIVTGLAMDSVDLVRPIHETR